MNKEIKISPELFESPSLRKNKTLKKPNTSLKKELLKSLAKKENETIKELETLMNPNEPEPNPKEPTELKDSKEIREIDTQDLKSDTSYGCLKNGTKPTFRQLKRAKTIKQYTSFGKNKDTVRVLIKDKDTYAKIEKDKKKLDRHSMTDIRNYLKTRKLYKIGSTAPDDVLREIYKDANLTGNVENVNTDTLVHNYLNDV
jgi:hypothetical protein